MQDDFDQVLGSSITYRIALDPHQGRTALVLRALAWLDGDDNPIRLLAKVSGYTLHAATCCEAVDREKLGRLGRYI